MKLGLGVGLSKSNISGVSIPFEFDSDTYWWDFEFSNNTPDDVGDDTLSFIPERIATVKNLEQITKDKQPLVKTDGVDFNLDTNRHLLATNVVGLTNGSNGWYFATNCRADTSDSYLLVLGGGEGTIYIPSNRQFGFKASDGTTGADWVARGPAVNLSQWYTLEMQWDTDNDNVTIWYDGVEQTLAFGEDLTPHSNFSASDTSNLVIGNGTTAGVTSFDGRIQQMMFYDNVPSTLIRESISAYLITKRP